MSHCFARRVSNLIPLQLVTFPTFCQSKVLSVELAAKLPCNEIVG